jgi:hypothetical protein
MPATSAKQKKFMDAAAHNPAFAKKVGVPVKVAKEFSKASKGQTFKKGGEMKESKAMTRKEVSFMKTKGAPKSMVKHEEAEMKNMKKGGKTEKYGLGGFLKKVASQIAPAVRGAASVPPAMAKPSGPVGQVVNAVRSGAGSASMPNVGPVRQVVNAVRSGAGNSSMPNVGPVSRAITAAMRRGMATGGNVTKMGAVKTAKPTSGSASSRADGIAQKGKTKGKMLKKGGKC